MFDHSEFIADSQQKDPAFSTVDCDLANDLIEALGVDLLPDRANTGISGLLLREAFVKQRLQVQDIEGGGGRRGHISDPKLGAIPDLLGRQNLIQVFFCAALALLHLGLRAPFLLLLFN